MIKRLRNKIIIINVSLAGIVLLTALFVVFRVGASRIQAETNRQMKDILSGSISEEQLQSDPDYADFALMIVDGDGNVSICANKRFLLDEKVLKEYASDIVDSPKQSGYTTMMRCSFRKTYDSQTGQTRIAILDGFSQKSNFGNYLTIVITSMLVGIALIFLLSYVLARTALAPIEESWDKQKQFVADASHELKTPISVIRANTDILLAHKDETVESQMKWIENTRQEAEQMANLVNSLLFLAKRDNEAPVQFETFNLSDCVSNVVLGHDALFYESGKTFDVSVQPDVEMLGNEQQLRQLTTILLDNATKYSVGEGNVLLTLSAAKSVATLTISNDSEELTDEQLGKIFDRFYTLDLSHNKNNSGNGLGLSIAKAIVETHNGKIRAVYDQHTRRATFTVNLPLFSKKQG